MKLASADWSYLYFKAKGIGFKYLLGAVMNALGRGGHGLRQRGRELGNGL